MIASSRRPRNGIIPACAGSTPTGSTAPPVTRDHPRVRGEHGVHDCLYGYSCGSSPRARGARKGEVAQLFEQGIIPACAGSTHPADAAGTGCWDHPRVRGEHLPDQEQPGSVRGSSPRARGARPHLGRRRQNLGIIPACAGSTTAGPARASPTTDHPRVRGEHAAAESLAGQTSGSSPRARGAQSWSGFGPCEPGIIPACAGSTTWLWKNIIVPADHPRVRGEHIPLPSGRGLGPGSSPRARGARLWRPLKRLSGGIIPACAGSTYLRPPIFFRDWDHPRVRGEHSRRGRGPAGLWGSSPRARGALGYRETGTNDTGIIPACAGSTTAPSRGRSGGRDHPRVRGEHQRGLLAGG